MRSFCHKILFWLLAEIVLNMAGFDQVANYSEFIFEQKAAIISSQTQKAAIMLFSPSQMELISETTGP